MGMADGTVRPTEKALRAAGLLPANRPSHYLVRGDSVVPQPELVAQVFGNPQVVGEKTMVPVAAVLHIGNLGSSAAEGFRETWRRSRHRVALVEVGDRGVRVRPVPGPVPLILLALLLAVWNIYWVARTAREWRARQMLG